MSVACPNKSSEQWKALVETVGENNAYKAWLRNKGEEFTPSEATYQLFLDDNLRVASSILAAYIPFEKIQEKTLSKNSLDLIRLAGEGIYSDPDFLAWTKQNKFAEKLSLEKPKYQLSDNYLRDIRNYTYDANSLDTPGIDERVYGEIVLDRTGIDSARANEIAHKLADKISQNLGIPYNMVTREQAENILADTETPYQGESAFFFAGRAHFVSDRINTTNVIHEFSHPLVRAIASENRVLFENLYKAAIAAPEFSRISDAMQEIYPDLDKESDLYKEEVIVHALEKASENKLTETPDSDNLKSFIKNLIYALKQLFRKMFGKGIKIDNLNPGTTLNQLASMLSSEKFEIETELITDEDIASYKRDVDKYMADLRNVENSEVVKIINRFYEIASRQVDMMRQNPKNFTELRQKLVSPEGTELLTNIKRQLRPHQTINVKNSSEVDEALSDLQKELATVQRQTNALVVSTLTLQEVATKIVKELSEINKSNESDSRSAVGKVFYYDYLLRYWKEFIDEAKIGLTEADVPATSELYKLISGIEGLVEQGVRITNQVYKKGSASFVEEQLKFMQSEIDRVNEEKKAVIEKNEKDPARKAALLQKLAVEYDKVKIDKERIMNVLEGKSGDMNQFNAFLEGFMNANDPIVGSAAVFLKNTHADIDNKVQGQFNKFMREIEPLLKKVGYNPAKIAELGSQMGFVDTVGYIDKEGNLQKKEVYTFLNPFKNYRYAIAEAKHNYEKARESDNKDEIAQAAKVLRALQRNYFHQEYVQEYYDLEEIFDTPLGQEAWLERQEILEKIGLHSGVQFTEYEQYQSYDEAAALWREYSQLYSLTDVNGEAKTGKQLEKAKLLREYRERSRKFFAEPNWDNATKNFETALTNFENQLESTEGFARGTAEFDAQVEDWIRKNSKIVYDESWYAERNRIINRIKEITASFNERVREDLDISKSWENIISIVSGYRDEDGQPIGSDLNEKQVSRVRGLQQDIIDAQSKLAGYTGLTQEEMEEFSGYMDMLQNRIPLSESENQRFHYLSELKNELGLSDLEKTELIQLFNDLRDIQRREPTSHYLDQVNYWMNKLGEGELTEDTANDILTEAEANKLMAKDKDFRAWFEANHVKRQVFDKETKENVDKWERLYIWSIVKPTNPSFLKKMTLSRKDSQGKAIEIYRLPSNRFYSRQVKKEFKTPRVIGETVDNQGNWLPRLTTAQTVKGVTLVPANQDSPFINQEYFALKQSDPDKFKLLEALVRNHLEFQGNILYGEEGQRLEGEERAAPRSSRLYMDFPRFPKSNLEYTQAGDLKQDLKENWNAFTSAAKGFKAFFAKRSDDFERGLSYNPEDNFKLARADMFDQEITSVPVQGIYNLDRDQVSLDILYSMTRYMYSVERQKKLIEINPMMHAMRQVLNDPDNAIKDLTRVSKFHYQHRNEIRFLNKKGRNIRAGAFNALYNRELLGETNIGFADRHPGIAKVTSWLMSRASFGFFALNIPSAIKNRWGQMFQNMIETAGGKYMSPQSYALGRVWSAKAMMEYSSKDLYKRGAKSLNTQLIEIFDPIRHFESKFGETASRTAVKDALSGSWLYSPRKFMEIEATLQMFGGMMNHQYIEQTFPDGSKKQIKYIDAWELDKDGQIVLKQGIDKSWGMGGENYKVFRNRVHEVANTLNGAYAKFDQPDAQRYILFRLVSFMRKYFTSMFMNRFGFSTAQGNVLGYRYNWGLGTMQRGYYITSMMSMLKMMTSFGKHWMYMTKDEKASVRKFATEMIALYVIQAILPFLFGWDPDDPDRYEKLRAKVYGPGGDEFNVDEYSMVHLLNLLMQVRSENEQFVPLPGYGLDSYMEFKNLTSVVFGPTTDTYSKILNDLWMLSWGDDRAYYQKDMGPYPWQKKESMKLWNHVGSAFGVTGSSVDPVKAIQGFQGIQARYR